MAKEATKKPAAESKPTFKYGVRELAEASGLTDFTVRTKLRSLEVEKNGSQYGWNNKTDFEAIVKQLKAKPEKAAKAEPAAKPAKKAPAKKAAAAATLKKKPKKEAAEAPVADQEEAAAA